MNLQRVFFKAMLWSLAAAAAFGALGMFVADARSMWRVCATAVLAAISTGLLWPISMLVDRKTTRLAGLIGMVGVLLSFFFAIPFVWDMLGHDWDYFSSMWTIFLTTPFAMFAGWMVCKKQSRIAGFAGLATCLLFVLTLLAAIWIASTITRTYLDNQLAGSAVFLATFGVLISACLVNFGHYKRHWRWLGITTSTFGLVYSFYQIWTHNWWDSEEFIVPFIALAAAIAHNNLMLIIPLQSGQRWVRILTNITAWFAAVSVSLMAIAGIDGFESTLFRMTGASIILASAGTLALVVLARINRRVEFEISESNLLHITVVCPRCRKKQDIKLGDGKCQYCALRISIKVEEPRCPKCGYLLYMLTSNHCPECGTPIDQNESTTPAPNS